MFIEQLLINTGNRWWFMPFHAGFSFTQMFPITKALPEVDSRPRKKRAEKR